MERLRAFLKGMFAYVGRMSPSQVMMLLGVTTGVVVGLVFAIGWLNSVTYSRLYSDLDEAEAGEIISYLNEHRIPYELSEGGRTVAVPSDQVYQLRISLASEGLPRHGSMGYSIFDKSNLGMTDFLQNLNFRRALEGELTRTIMQLSEVQAARVHIVMPRERLFKEDQKQATASVVLKLRGRAALTQSQVRGVSHLVASSVEGLRPENITIVDYDGTLLSSNEPIDAVAGLSTSQLEVRKQVEEYLEQKAQTMLDGVLGAGKSIVRVTADLDFQQIERTSETFDPNTASIRSEERTKTAASTADKAAEENESTQDESTETTITNYELNKTVEHLVNAVGTISRLAVAVTVDGSYSPAGTPGGGTEYVYQPRSQEELDRLASIVRNAVGFDQERNDQIEMVNMPFDRQNLQQDQQALDTMYTREFYLNIARKAVYILAAVILLLYLRRKSKRLFGALARLMPPPSPPPEPDASMEVNRESDTAAEQIKRQPRLVDRMQNVAKKEPAEIAKVIKTMMIE